MLGGGTIGYTLIEGWDPLRSLFFTLITITTIGYGDYGLDRTGEHFTAVVILAALGLFTYSFGQLLEGIATYSTTRAKKMERCIRSMTEHFVVCGLGRMGSAVCEKLDEIGAPFVGVDPSEGRVGAALDRGWLAIAGDATDDDVLEACAATSAKALFCCAARDTDNIVITLSARGMSDGLFILSRAEEEESIRKLERAGASKVISPIGSGAVRAVDMVLKPHLSEIMENATGGSSAVEIAEISIGASMGSGWRTIHACGARHPSVAFVAVRRTDGHLTFNVSPDEALEAGDVLIVAGEQRCVCEMAVAAREARMAA